jgi:hypothetical protein
MKQQYLAGKAFLSGFSGRNAATLRCNYHLKNGKIRAFNIFIRTFI